MSKLYRVYVEAFIFAEDEQDASDVGYYALSDKIMCGDSYVEVEDIDE